MRLIDGDQLLEWLESEIASTSPADYVTAMKWTSYNIDKGRFDIPSDTGVQKVRELYLGLVSRGYSEQAIGVEDALKCLSIIMPEITDGGNSDE